MSDIQPRCESCLHFTPAEKGFCMFFGIPMSPSAIACTFYLPSAGSEVN